MPMWSPRRELELALRVVLAVPEEASAEPPGETSAVAGLVVCAEKIATMDKLQDPDKI